MYLQLVLNSQIPQDLFSVFAWDFDDVMTVVDSVAYYKEDANGRMLPKDGGVPNKMLSLDNMYVMSWGYYPSITRVIQPAAQPRLRIGDFMTIKPDQTVFMWLPKKTKHKNSNIPVGIEEDIVYHRLATDEIFPLETYFSHGMRIYTSDEMPTAHKSRLRHDGQFFSVHVLKESTFLVIAKEPSRSQFRNLTVVGGYATFNTDAEQMVLWFNPTMDPYSLLDVAHMTALDETVVRMGKAPPRIGSFLTFVPDQYVFLFLPKRIEIATKNTSVPPALEEMYDSLKVGELLPLEAYVRSTREVFTSQPLRSHIQQEGQQLKVRFIKETSFKVVAENPVYHLLAYNTLPSAGGNGLAWYDLFMENTALYIDPALDVSLLLDVAHPIFLEDS